MKICGEATFVLFCGVFDAKHKVSGIPRDCRGDKQLLISIFFLTKKGIIEIEQKPSE